MMCGLWVWLESLLYEVVRDVMFAFESFKSSEDFRNQNLYLKYRKISFTAELNLLKTIQAFEKFDISRGSSRKFNSTKVPTPPKFRLH